MARNITVRATALALSAVVTVCTLLALDSLAASEHASLQQQAAAVAAPRA